jgi:hypothetical protein
MSIINKKFIKLFENYPLGSQELEKDPLVVAKLFDIAGKSTWYLTEFDPETKLAFGYVAGLSNCDEWGNIFIPELEEVKHFGIPRIEQDLNFQSQPISQVLNQRGANE